MTAIEAPFANNRLALTAETRRLTGRRAGVATGVIMSERIRHVTDETFEQDVLGSAGPALVDYWAEWCMPCRMIAPLLDDSAAHYGERLRIAKLDVDANPATASRYRVRSIPTLMLFRDGKV